MRWAAHCHLDDDLEVASQVCAQAVRSELGAEPDLVLAFVSPTIDDTVAHTLVTAFPKAVVVGCAAGGVVGGNRELEGRPAVSLTAAHLPGTHIEVQAFGAELGAKLEPRHLRAALAPKCVDPALVLTLLDPRAGAPTGLLGALDEAFPNAVVVGGLASGPTTRPALLVDGRASSAGGIMVALQGGGLEARAVVAQGCRPIGEPMLLTRVEGQLVHEMGQRRPIDVMRDLHARLSADDQALFQSALFLGIEMRDQLEYAQGDFLVRNVLGIEPKSGALAVGAELEPWKAVQFHLRDAATSAEDLSLQLTAAHADMPVPEVALLFSCMGRGEGLYGVPSHDTRLIRETFENLPVGGFFGNGEIGPVAGQTHLHGHTSAIALLRAEPQTS